MSKIFVGGKYVGKLLALSIADQCIAHGHLTENPKLVAKPASGIHEVAGPGSTVLYAHYCKQNGWGRAAATPELAATRRARRKSNRVYFIVK